MIVFARTRWVYDSYRDFWHLVELAGFPVCYVDEIDLSLEHVYILTPYNGEVEPVMLAKRRALVGPARARVIWWNLERPDVPGSPPLHDVVTKALESVTDVWVADRHYRALDERQQHVSFGSHPGLAQCYGTEEPFSVERHEHLYDYAHISYVHGRRVAIHEQLKRLGLREAPGGGDHQLRDRVLRQSRVLISTHQTPSSLAEQSRLALAAAYHMPLVCEHLADPYPMRVGEHYLDATAESLPLVVRDLSQPAERESVRRDLGNRLFRLLCEEHSFRTEIEAGVKRLP